MKLLIELAILACAASSADAHPATHRSPTVLEKAALLGRGQYVWDGKAAANGALFLIVDLSHPFNGLMQISNHHLHIVLPKIE